MAADDTQAGAVKPARGKFFVVCGPCLAKAAKDGLARFECVQCGAKGVIATRDLTPAYGTLGDADRGPAGQTKAR